MGLNQQVVSYKNVIEGNALNAVAVLIITCPCAMGLAVPIVQIVSSTKLISNGIIIKSKNALEKLADIDTIIFDKTGTLTYLQPKIDNLDEISYIDRQLIKSMSTASKHPLCVAIRDSIDIDPIQIEVHEEKGMGLSCSYKNQDLKLGNRSWCDINVDINDTYSEMWFKRGENFPIRLKFSNTLRDEGKSVIENLKSKYDIWIVSGDRFSSVESVAKMLNVNQFKYRYSPKEKYDFIVELNNQGKKVLMVGDGLNDSPAIKKAHVSLSPMSSIDITLNHADIVFQNNLNLITKCIHTALKSKTIVKQNFILAFAYNVVSVPIAMLGYITPLIAAISMSLSSICVVLNSLRLKNDKNT